MLCVLVVASVYLVMWLGTRCLVQLLLACSFLLPACALMRPSPPLPSCPQEYLNDYASPEQKKIGEELIAKEKESGLSDSAKRMLTRKLEKVNEGERDVYI